MAFKWNRDLIEKLITCIEQNDCIYNVKCKEYLDRVKKAQAYNNILKEMQAVASSITIDEIKRKWKNLRTQYMQEQRRIKQSKKSGAGTADVYVTKLWCFQQLNFLQVHTNLRESINNKEVLIQELQSEIGSIEENSIDEPPPKRKKGSSAINVFRNEVENFKTIINQKKTEKKFAWLGNLVTCRMEEIRPQDQDDAAWQVQCFMRKLCSKSASAVAISISEEAPPCSTQKKNLLDQSVSRSTESIDILELSLQGIFDDDDEDYD